MTGLIIIILFLIAIAPINKPPPCPPLLPERTPLYAQIGSPEYNEWLKKELSKEIVVEINGEKYITTMATTSRYGTQIGEEINQENVERNKSARECLETL